MHKWTHLALGIGLRFDVPPAAMPFGFQATGRCNFPNFEQSTVGDRLRDQHWLQRIRANVTRKGQQHHIVIKNHSTAWNVIVSETGHYETRFRIIL